MKKTRFISLLLCLCMVMSLFAGLTVTASADDGVIDYTVVKGDYLLKICMRHGLNYYQCKGIIMVLNGFTSEQQLNRISPGQVIKLPASNSYTGSTSTVTVVSSTPAKTTSSVAGSNLADFTVGYYLVPVEVKKNDTLNGMCSKLGTDYNTYASQILAINGLKNANSIQVGKTLWLPSLTAPSSGSCYGVVAHKVASGENVTDICAKYGVNYLGSKQLVDGMNPTLNLNKIYANQVISIPVATTGGTTSTIGTKINSDETSANAQISGYQISFATAVNGSPYAVVGGKNFATRAPAGTSVVIVPNPKDGYTVESIKVQRTDGQPALQVTGTSFTMPESNVIITVTYRQGLTIVKEVSKNGSFDTLVYGAAATTAGFGDEIVIMPYPDAGYSLTKVEYKRADAPASTPYQNVAPDKTTGVYKFNMPNYESGTKIRVSFAKTQLCTLVDLTNSFGGTVKFLVNGSAVTQVEKNTNVTVKFEPNSGWVFDNATFENAANANFTINGTATNFVALLNNGDLKKVDDTTYSLYINSNWTSVALSPPAGITFFNNYNAYSLSYNATAMGYIYFNVTDSRTGEVRKNTNWARENDIVEIVPYPYNADPNAQFKVQYVYVPDDSTTLQRWVNGTMQTPTNPVQGTWRFVTNRETGVMMPAAGPGNRWLAGQLGYCFMMPAYNVHVRPQFFDQAVATAQTYYLISAEDSAYGMITATVGGNPATSTLAGNTVNVTISCAQNYTVDKAYWYDAVNGWTQFINGATTGSFVMPANNTSIHVDFKEQYNNVTVEATNQDYIQLLPGSGATMLNTFNEPVTLKVNDLRISSNIGVGAQIPVQSVVKVEFKVDEGFILDRVEKTGGSGTELLKPDGNGIYAYRVTAADAAGGTVRFVVTTRPIDKPKYTVVHNLLGLAAAANGSYDLFNVTQGVTVTNDNLVNVEEGDEIIIRNIVPPTAPAGMVFDDIIITGVDYWVDGGAYRFIMPDQNVSVSVSFMQSAKPYTISFNLTGTGTATCSPYSAIEGEGVEITIVPDPGFVFDTAGAQTYNPGGVDYSGLVMVDPVTGVATFGINAMPAANVTVNVPLKVAP